MEEQNDISPKSSLLHEVRITDHTKIQLYVRFALKYLKENPGAVLVLHTLPAAERTQRNENGQEPPAKKKRKFPSPTENIPRLISIAEIIKREFAAIVASNMAGEGNPLGTLLHQYNMLDCLLTPETEQDENILALEGKNHLKRSSIPYMKIHLSTQLQSNLGASGATYQEPLSPPKKSKSARARERKKQRSKEKSEIPVTVSSTA